MGDFERPEVNRASSTGAMFAHGFESQVFSHYVDVNEGGLYTDVHLSNRAMLGFSNFLLLLV